MSESGSIEDQLKLEFETPQFLQSLFANDFRELRYLEEALRLRVVSREGWILLSGAPEQVEKGRKLFADLEQARRGGAEFSGRSFRLAVDLVAGDSEVGVADLAQLRLLGTMRGRTLARSFVILDEAQNTTREQMFMLLTRLGEGSRCVVTGDGSQVDLKQGVRSGLEEAERVLAEVEGVGMLLDGPTSHVCLPASGGRNALVGRHFLLVESMSKRFAVTPYPQQTLSAFSNTSTKATSSSETGPSAPTNIFRESRPSEKATPSCDSIKPGIANSTGGKARKSARSNAL